MSAISNIDLEARERLVDAATTDNFAELIRIAGLDPKKHLRFADWSGVDFSGSDLRGFDFTGAKLIGCDFKGALIEGARFDQALIDEVQPGEKLDPGRTNLRGAKDWERYAKGWKQPEKPAPEHLPPGAVFQDAPFAPEMVVVPPGRFWMGSQDGEGNDSERPRHEVTIPQALAVGRFPVTFEEWGTAHTQGGVEHDPSNSGWRTGRRPVIDVSWDDVHYYVEWLSGKTGKPYRLLSEAEWEYACQAETEVDRPSRGMELGTIEVGSFTANDFGLYDIHGNVRQWCEDLWHESYADKPEGLAQVGGAWTTGAGSRRVLRGGSWYDDPRSLRSEKRGRYYAGNEDDSIGFRVARAIMSF